MSFNSRIEIEYIEEEAFEEDGETSEQAADRRIIKSHDLFANAKRDRIGAIGEVLHSIERIDNSLKFIEQALRDFQKKAHGAILLYFVSPRAYRIGFGAPEPRWKRWIDPAKVVRKRYHSSKKQYQVKSSWVAVNIDNPLRHLQSKNMTPQTRGLIIQACDLIKTKKLLTKQIQNLIVSNTRMADKLELILIEEEEE